MNLTDLLGKCVHEMEKEIKAHVTGGTVSVELSFLPCLQAAAFFRCFLRQ